MKQQDKIALAAHMAQERLARAAQYASAMGGLIGAYWVGPAAIILGFIGYLFFAIARPGPNDRLDKITGR